MAHQVKCWIITVNNPTYSDLVKVNDLRILCESMSRLPNHDNTIKFIKMGVEFNDVGEGMHYQGYIAFDKKMTLRAAKSYGNNHWHWEPAGSRQSDFKNIADYIGRPEKKKKDNNGNIIGTYVQPLNYVMFEIGEGPSNRGHAGGQAAADMWALAKEQAIKRKFDEMDAGILIRNYNNVKRIANDFAPKPEDLPECTGIYIWGPSGVGKSYLARKLAGLHHIKSADDKWYDGYEQEGITAEEILERGRSVIMDDVDHTQGKFLENKIKIWADRYAFDAEYKGGKFFIRPKFIIITSNFSLEHVFGHVQPATMVAIKRRFRVIKLTDRIDEIPELPAVNTQVSWPVPAAADTAVIDLTQDEAENGTDNTPVLIPATQFW